MISFAAFNTKQDQVARMIYGSEPHVTTNNGVILGPGIVEGLRTFLRAYNRFTKVLTPSYYRIDAYFLEDILYILEVNAAFVDGWGTALNLARASGVYVRRELLKFPKFFATLDPVYLPELRLFVSELEQLEINGNRVCELRELGADESAYVYGRFNGHQQFHYPMEGIKRDNKMNLALFSQRWKQDGVPGIRIPRHFVGRGGLSIEPTPWDDLTEGGEDFPSFGHRRRVVLKFCDKSGTECQKFRKSVIIGVPEGKNKYLRRCYEFGALIAQSYIRPKKFGSDNCQLIILAADDEPVTGYVQYSPKDVISDNSVHGPLALLG